MTGLAGRKMSVRVVERRRRKRLEGNEGLTMGYLQGALRPRQTRERYERVKRGNEMREGGGLLNTAYNCCRWTSSKGKR